MLFIDGPLPAFLLFPPGIRTPAPAPRVVGHRASGIGHRASVAIGGGGTQVVVLDRAAPPPAYSTYFDISDAGTAEPSRRLSKAAICASSFACNFFEKSRCFEMCARTSRTNVIVAPAPICINGREYQRCCGDSLQLPGRRNHVRKRRNRACVLRTGVHMIKVGDDATARPSWAEAHPPE
ncbi:hypothetical protein ACFWU3_10605 [Streptomyces sp. NPDC058685]|uniref:hypothetical protein n=1 Tax=Streptomyces sp. NPDC058685 TaxID=3346598 RepID=UPI003653B3D3